MWAVVLRLLPSFSLPPHSWETLPVAWHSALDHLPTAEEVRTLALFPLVTLEKATGSEAYRWPHGLPLACQNGTDLSACGCCAEDHMVAAGRAIKAASPSTQVLGYMNSIISYPWYRAARAFVRHPSWWLRNASGGLLNNVRENPVETWLAWDFGHPEVGALWREACTNMTGSGAIDGCFMDGCSLTPGPLTSAAAAAYEANKPAWMARLQQEVPGILICGSGGTLRPGVAGTQLQNWGKHGDYATREIPMLQRAVARGVVFEAHAACGAANISDPFEQTKIAAFLVAAGPHSYYMCGGWGSATVEWHPVFDLPLGPPVGNATLVDGVFTRRFAKGTVARFDTRTNNGTVTLPTTAPRSRAVLAPGFVGRNWSALRVAEVAMPTIQRPTDVVVRVVGSSVNPVDWKLIERRTFPGIPAAFPARLGMDMAGVVVAVGEGCTRLGVGDRVWADLADDGLGGYSTYTRAEEAHLGLIPAGLAWDAASVLPLVSMTSLAALKQAGSADWGRLAPTVMVLGGSGGCGFTGIQMAKAFGARAVWTTTSLLNFGFVKSLGATRVFDYEHQDWTRLVAEDSVDVVYDTVGEQGSAQRAMRAIKPGGWFVTIAGEVAPRPKPGVRQKFIHGWMKNATALDEIAALVAAGHLVAEIESVYDLHSIARAFADSAAGQVVGKLFINTTA